MSIKVENVSFNGKGLRLLGRTYHPNKSGKYPSVVLCLGYPGDNKNMDLAEELALNDIAVLIFYYPGSWGSEGKYSIRSVEPSVRDAVEFLRSLPFVEPKRIGLIGYSFGSVPVTSLLRGDTSLRTGVYVGPSSSYKELPTGDELKEALYHYIEQGKGKLKGLTLDTMASEITWIGKNLNPIDLIKEVKVPIMIVEGSEDREIPPENAKKFFDAANEPKKWVLIEGADHFFSEHRMQLINTVLEWLKEHL